MRLFSLSLKLASASMLLASIPGVQARGLPAWLQAKRHDLEDAKNLPREYAVYNNHPRAYEGYTYPGYGPPPTATRSSSSGEVSSDDSGGAASVEPYDVQPTQLPQVFQRMYLNARTAHPLSLLPARVLLAQRPALWPQPRR
ncbi:hypothetical protein PZA11_006938 [Diplocarpon coronariae]